MESIIADIVKIIKSENNVIAREKALMCYFFDLIRELMTAALEEVDAGLVEETKKQGYQIEKKNKRSVVTTFGEISYWRRRYACPGKKKPLTQQDRELSQRFLLFESRSSMYLARSKHTKYFLLRIAIIADVLI
ncbi:Transposase [Lactobacillus helveticus CIRM-BIA 951]|uniref:Transposase n=1 Tax=Lactobacillus helveticus CIRM-BIA 951 TaxID=1226334 RepID=U6F528_LACHE|nr:Transposase [Lactobacillus helveticus CIRM-BIA 951]